MSRNRKSLVLLSITTLLVSACSFPQQNNNLIPKNAQFVKIDGNGVAQNKAEKPVVYVVDLNKGKKEAKPGASIVVNIAPSKDLFNTKASTNGKNSLAISSVRVNLCTDATQPYATRIIPNGFVLSRTGVASGSQLTTIVFQNVPVGGPYNATFTADSSALPGGSSSATEGFVMVNNNGSAYSAPDAGARIAVSSNQVSVTSALALVPPAQVLTVTANMEVMGAMVDTNVTTNDIGTPTFGIAPFTFTSISTLAGSTQGFINATGAAARFNNQYGIATDSTGNIFVADGNNNVIRKVTPAGVVTTFATGFNSPSDIAIDSANNLYVTDVNTHTIKKVTNAGVVTTLAGSGTNGSADGTGVAAQFNVPYGITIDSTDSNLYVTDQLNHRIRKITLPGAVVTTFAGSTQGFNNATGAAARFNNPVSIRSDSSNNLYVTDNQNFRIRKITTPGAVVTTFAGSGANGSADGTGASAQFSGTRGITVNKINGDIYVGDTDTNRKIRKITSAGVVTTLAGNGTTTPGTGALNATGFNNVFGLALNSEGSILYVSDTNNHLIRKIQ
jgi:sugar lactone lactonase YvrE